MMEGVHYDHRERLVAAIKAFKKQRNQKKKKN